MVDTREVWQAPLLKELRASRRCSDCRYFEGASTPDVETAYPIEDGLMCHLRKWDWRVYADCALDLSEALRTAATCDDYAEVADGGEGD